MNSDAELLARYVRENSNGAFAELVHRHMGMVYGAALRQLGGSRHLAEDAAQTVFVALARKARTLQHRQTLAGWLYLSTRHAAAQLARTESRRRNREEAHTMHEQLTREITPEWERIQELLDPALTQLRDSDREAVLLRYVEGRSFAEIGSLLSTTADAARMRVDRALERLRALLEQRGINSTAAALGAALSSHAATLPAAEFASRVSHVATTVRATDAAVPAFGTWAAVAFVTAIGVGTAVYYDRHAGRTEAELRLTAQQRNEALAQLAAARDDTRTLRQQLQDLRPTAAHQVAPASNNDGKAQAPAASLGKEATAARIGAWTLSSVDGRKIESHYFVDSPEGRRESIGIAVADRYAPYFRQMGWTPEQQAKFTDLFFEKKEAAQTAMKEAFGTGNRPSRESMKEIVEAAERDFEAKMEQVFGQRAVDLKRDFEAKIPLRNMTDQLAKRLFNSATPLVNWQADQLVDLMANHSPKGVGSFDIRRMDSAAVLNQSQAFLSAPQLSALREVDAEQRKQRELEQRMLAERGTVPGAVPNPGN